MNMIISKTVCTYAQPAVWQFVQNLAKLHIQRKIIVSPKTTALLLFIPHYAQSCYFLHIGKATYCATMLLSDSPETLSSGTCCYQIGQEQVPAKTGCETMKHLGLQQLGPVLDDGKSSQQAETSRIPLTQICSSFSTISSAFSFISTEASSDVRYA